MAVIVFFVPVAPVVPLLALLCWTAPVQAQITDVPNPVIFPDPAKFARGLYTEGEIGALIFFGAAGDRIGPGGALGARVGYDVARWLALQAHAIGSTHETRFAGMPQAGQIIQ